VRSHDLIAEVPETIRELRADGLPATVTAVLDRLGVTPATGPAREPEPDGVVTLGRFRLGGELGRGGMGRIVEARDPELRRSVAIKLLRDPSHVSRVQLARFVAEARVTAQLQHPNIVPVHEIGVEADGRIYFVMKRVEGRSLAEVLQALRDGDPGTAAAFSRHRLITALLAVCNAVAFAHDRGVLHRDIKPANIMLGRFGEVLLMDWGIARLAGRVEEDRLGPVDEVHQGPRGERFTITRTKDGVAIGTPGYMAPEQAMGLLSQLDGRADVWSLGAVLYEVLTLGRAHRARGVQELLVAAATTRPEDPRARAPERRIPEGIAGICMRALAIDPAGRFPDAAGMAAAIEASLEGSRRRSKAAVHLAEAERSWSRWQDLGVERDRLAPRLAALEAQTPGYTPLASKPDLLAARRQLQGLGVERARAFARYLAEAEQALSSDPESLPAREALARGWYARFEEAEAAADPADLRLAEARCRRYDTGRYDGLLRGDGSLSLRTAPSGAEVVARRFDRVDPVWSLGEPRSLGRTPLRDVRLERGSWLLELRHPDFAVARYPVELPRGGSWDSGERPVPLYTADEIGAGFVYVPRGPFIVGGDPSTIGYRKPTARRFCEGFFIARLPVTMELYGEFIRALAEEDPEAAWRRVPRQPVGQTNEQGEFWPRPPDGVHFEVPSRGPEGEVDYHRWPVFGISWTSALSYARWCSERDDRSFVLPKELWWEKAARGVDGRAFPWGDGFDPALCKMQSSRPGRARPEPVGAFAGDVSVYGVRDMAGGSCDWAGDEDFDGDLVMRPYRGGGWSHAAPRCEAAARSTGGTESILSVLGVRLAARATRG
jgi:eukaryotic-like serine/threonine-protein kinase